MLELYVRAESAYTQLKQKMETLLERRESGRGAIEDGIIIATVCALAAGFVAAVTVVVLNYQGKMK